MGGTTPLGFIESLQVADFCKDLGFYLTDQPFYEIKMENADIYKIK
jgi:hypothetical protein